MCKPSNLTHVCLTHSRRGRGVFQDIFTVIYIISMLHHTSIPMHSVFTDMGKVLSTFTCQAPGAGAACSTGHCRWFNPVILLPLSCGRGESSTGALWVRYWDEPWDLLCLCAFLTDFLVKPSTFSDAEMADIFFVFFWMNNPIDLL